MREVRAALLAGGLGERMGRLTDRVCKPLVPYAAACRLVDFSIDNARRSGIPELVLLSQHREHALVDHLLRHWDRPGQFSVHFGPHDAVVRMAMRAAGPGRGLPPGVRLGPRPPERGTADALLSNAEHLFAPGATDVLVQHADHVYRYDYAPMLRAHRDGAADATIGVQRIERRFVRLFGMVEVDADGAVTDLVEKPAEPSSDLIFTAFCLFRSRPLHGALAELAAGPDDGWQHDISRDVLPYLIRSGHRVRAFPVTGYWADIGTVERYHLGHLTLLHDPSALPARLVPRTLPGASPRLVAGTRPNLLTGDPPPGCVRQSVLYPGCVVEPGASVERSVVLPGARVPAGVTVRESIVLDGETVTEDRTGLSALERASAVRPEGEV
jgi:ADP-glucose pyrophosphorylase